MVARANHFLAAQSVAHRTAALASPRRLLEMQHLEFHINVLNQHIHVNKSPTRLFICTLYKAGNGGTERISNFSVRELTDVTGIASSLLIKYILLLSNKSNFI